jgi:DNA polymerase
VVDFSQIEARLLAWESGQHDILAVFGRGEDVYTYTAGRLGSGATRQLGKTTVLSCGYGLGPGKFQKLCKLGGIRLDEARAKETVYGWREANPMIVDFWKALERGFQEACADVPYRIESVAGNPALGIKVIRSFAKGVPVIGIRLPSGRHLVYRQPRQVREIDDRTGTVRWRPGYMGVDPLTKRWTQLTTFGGELAGHFTQATARELMADLMMRVERFPRFEIVGTVHDEIVCEGPDADHDENLALLLKLAKTPPSWAQGLPVNAEGWWGYRYGK